MSDPVDPAAQAPLPPVPPLPQAPAYAPPAGQVPPAGYTPPAGYAPQAPPYAAPYAAPPGYGAQPVYAAPPRPKSEPGSPVLGIVALIAAVVAAVGAPIVGAIAAFNIGLGAGKGMANLPIDADFDFSILTPVREWVLVGELSFWIGTALGVWAIIQGIIAIIRNRGRVPAIIAVAVAALGPVIFGIAVQATLTAGLAAGSSIGG